MASNISGAADFKVIPLDPECLLLAVVRPWCCGFECPLSGKQTLRFFLASPNDSSRYLNYRLDKYKSLPYTILTRPIKSLSMLK